jgi:hypothetical protein
MSKYEFTDETRALLPKMMGWFWTTFDERNFLDFGVSIEDFNFMYDLWKNGVWKYDDKMRDRLNHIRDIYLKMNTKK